MQSTTPFRRAGAGYLCQAMRKVKDTIPVYDICTLSSDSYHSDDLIAERFSDYLKVHPHLHRAHGHSFYHFVLFTKGGGFHTIDFNHFSVEAGAAYFMIPGQVHSWSFEGETDGFVVNFSEAFFQTFLKDDRYLERFPFFSGEAREQVVKLDVDQVREASILLSQVVAENKEHGVFQADSARLLLLSFFILVARAGTFKSELREKGNPGAVVLQNFRKLLNQHYHQFKLPKDYAAMLYVTPNYLNALCNDLLGKPAGEMIRERILLEAKRQLVNLDEQIAGIGYSLGFKDNSYFTKFFKKYTGQTPEEFRKQVSAPGNKN
jgi:AraC-like DNA-binding protein